MEYMTLQEVKEYLSMPARMIERIPIHKCEQGYAREVVERFAQRHRIPAPEDTHILAVKNDVDGWISVDSWEQSLWWADRDTIAIVGECPPEDVYNAVVDDNPRPLVAAIEGEHGDVFPVDWEDAYDLLEDLCRT